MNKKVTVLLSTYNGERYIEEQLRSIENQIGSIDIEILIRDDGSTDKTVELIKNWNGLIPLKLFIGENKGVIKSFYELLKESPDSDYYAFCDQDDIWNPEKISTAIRFLEKEELTEKPLLYFSNACLVDEKGISLNVNVHSKKPKLELSSVLCCNPALGCTMVFNKKARNMASSFRINQSPMHDKDMIIMCLLTGKVIYDHTPRMMYRQHSNNVMGRKNSISKRVKQTYKLWLKQDGCPVDTYAQELLELFSGHINKEDEKKLKVFSNYKKNIKYRLILLTNKDLYTHKRRINFSFKLRALLGLA